MRKNALKIKIKLGTYIRQVHIFFHDIGIAIFLHYFRRKQEL